MLRLHAAALADFACFAAALPANAVEVTFWSVQAEATGATQKAFGAGLEPVRPALEDLPHDAFTLLKKGGMGVEPGKPAQASVADKYELRVETFEDDDPQRIRLRVIVEYSAAGAAPVKALDTRVVLAPGKQVRMGGMKLDKGDLVLVISAR